MVPLKRLIKSKFQAACFAQKRNLSKIWVNEEIRQALFEKQAVVALESTIITHGMKFPENYKTATAVQNIIRDQGAVPATIAVLKGQIKVGLSDEELEILAQNQVSSLKISRRDYPYVIAQKLTGGTTVSGTMLVAHKVGIPIFVTGGVGGVHREGENSLDISADLTELGRTPVAVISSGIKSILDIEKTLEYLETKGVMVATFGSTKNFPAFYCSTSEYESPYNITSYLEAAQLIQTIFNLELNSGVLIGVPIPEEYSLNGSEICIAIEEGLGRAKKNNIKGKAVTPFLLKEIAEITQGKSLEANIGLIKNNALVGARIAVEYAKLRRDDFADVGNSFPSDNTPESIRVNQAEKYSVVVIGAANLDLIVNITDDRFRGTLIHCWLACGKMNTILKGIMKYRRTDRVAMVEQFKVVKDNPQPKAVFFTCIDSRMIPTRFTETCVGDMFVVRNAGNIIPHSRFYPDEITTNEPAALELGCVINNIRHIIVCGHSDCKAMNLLYSLRDKEYANLTNKRISPLRAWMCAHATSSLERFLQMEEKGPSHPLLFRGETPFNKFVAYIDPENKLRIEDRLSQVHTLQQLQNIASYGFLRSRLEKRDLHVHALWFDIYTGEVYYFSRSAKQFIVVNEETIMQLLREVNTYYR